LGESDSGLALVPDVAQVGAMIEIEDIRDRESLEQWLKEWFAETDLGQGASESVAAILAYRMSMRVLPVMWRWTWTEPALEKKISPLSTLWPALATGLAIEKPSKLNRTAAAFAAFCANVGPVFLLNGPDDEIPPVNFVHFAVAAMRHAASTITAQDVAEVSRLASDAFSNRDSTTVSGKTGYGLNYGRGYGGLGDTKVFWEAVQSDCVMITRKEGVFAAPLWAKMIAPLSNEWNEIKSLATAPEWSFWIKWYDDALAGNPQNWKMLEAIALIEPEVWEEGAEAVAEKIAVIAAKYDLLDAIKILKSERSEPPQSMANAAHRGHNQPPELVDLPAEVSASITTVWASLDDAEKELEKADPDVELLKEFANAILRGIADVVGYCAKVGDTAIMAGAKTTGAAGGVYLVDYYFNSGRVLEFANRLLQNAPGG